MAYAGTEDYLLLYDTDADEARLEAFLDKASRKIDAALAERGAKVPDDPDEVEGLSDALRDVCCDMVHRVLGDSGGYGMPDGVTSYSQTQGGFSESFAWAQPYSDLKLRPDELGMLLGLVGDRPVAVGQYRMWGGEVQ